MTLPPAPPTPQHLIAPFKRAAHWIQAHDARLYFLALLGGVFYVLSGLNFSIDGVKCANWPSTQTGTWASVSFITGLILLSMAWLGLDATSATKHPRQLSLWPSLVAALMLHAMVMIVPPFLSNDTLAYASIGSASAMHGQSMYMPLGLSLPSNDAYRQLIAQYPAWLASGSTYGPVFNMIAAAIITLAGDNVALALRLFQGLAALAIFATALVAGEAAKAWTMQRENSTEASTVRLRVVRLVLFSPLALIEASSNGHNDALLALSVALFAWLTVKSRPFSALALLTASLAFKVSGIVLLTFYLTQQIASRITAIRTLLWIGLLLGSAASVALWFAWPLIAHSASTIVRLIGSPDQAYPFCTRSLECMPRALFHLALDAPWASWLTGLVFRAAAAAFLLTLALRTRGHAQVLTAAALFIFSYYLLFHAYMQAWYLLSLLPLLYFLPPRFKPAAMTFLISSLAQYALDFTLACTKSSPGAELREILGWMIVLLPPLLVLLWGFYTSHKTQKDA